MLISSDPDRKLPGLCLAQPGAPTVSATQEARFLGFEPEVHLRLARLLMKCGGCRR